MVQYQQWLIAANRRCKFLTLPSIITVATLTVSSNGMADDISSPGERGSYNGEVIPGTTLARVEQHRQITFPIQIDTIPILDGSTITGTITGSSIAGSGGTITIQNTESLPSPGNGGTPRGETSPGTTRPEIACPDSDHDITALIHNQGSDITSTLQPTLWFYIPYSQSEIQSIRFVLWDDRERNILLESNVEFLGEPGFLGITLPDSIALENGQLYRWYFHVTCTGNPSLEPDKSVNGWMRFRQGDPARAGMTVLDLIAAGDWYDAIDLAARSYARDPETYQGQWSFVLEQLEADDLPIGLIDEPVLLHE